MSIEQIRARSTGSVSKLTNGVFTMHDGLAAVGDRKTILAAVDAVLALHAPVAKSFHAFAESKPYQLEFCSHDAEFWPCPTVTAITEALEGTK